VLDITGSEKKDTIDWPLDTNDVAFLVRPFRNDVTSVKQLFGDNDAANGFEALRAYDSNRDGVVNSSDARFKELRLWFDKTEMQKFGPEKSQPSPLKESITSAWPILRDNLMVSSVGL
jgi:hypothetical protein